MIPKTYYAVTGQQVATHPIGVLKFEATLNSGATAGLYVQLHNRSVTPADGQVPLKTWPAEETGYKEFKVGELRCTDGLYVCLSSTAATKTLAVGASDKLDVLMVETYHPEEPTGTVVVGNETSVVLLRTAWSNSAGHRKLMEAVVNDTGATLVEDNIRLLVTMQNASASVDVAVLPVVKGARNVFNFGRDGLDSQRFQSDKTAINGCTLYLAYVTTTGALAFASVGTAIKAEYFDHTA